jgi:hypothetical protein
MAAGQSCRSTIWLSNASTCRRVEAGNWCQSGWAGAILGGGEPGRPIGWAWGTLAFRRKAWGCAPGPQQFDESQQPISSNHGRDAGICQCLRGSMAGGLNRATSRSNTRWGGRTIKSAAIPPFGDTGSSSVVPSAFAGIMPDTCRRWPLQQTPPPARRHRRGRGKKIGPGSPPPAAPSWPMALRAVRGWLEPWIMLTRYWKAWSPMPPPPAVRQLLHWLESGHAIDLYCSV